MTKRGCLWQPLFFVPSTSYILIMKRLVQTAFLFFLFISLTACKSKVLYTASALPEVYLEFGSSNANTGVKLSWIFLENGQVFMKNNLFTAEQKMLPKKTAAALFSEAKRVKNSGFKMNMEGSYLGFVSLKTSNHERELQWSWPYGGTKDYPDELKRLYLGCLEASKLSSKELTLD